MKKTSSIPSHIGIIMDGNGRWAKKHGYLRIVGHTEGVKVVKKITTYAAEIGVKYLSLFAFSTENWLRPKDEVNTLMDILDDYLESEIKTIIDEDIRFVVSGDINKIPISTREKIVHLENISKNNKKMVLNIALSYGGQDEIARAAANIATDYKEGKISLDSIHSEFQKYLYNPFIPAVDLLIRTSGEMRISNFMLWRIAYAELYFTNTHWPEFGSQDLDKAITEYSKRKRRFGMTDEQLDSLSNENIK